MHWNVPPDALPGSATFVLFWTAGVTTGYAIQQSKNECTGVQNPPHHPNIVISLQA